ncbi:hypothetical protein BH10CYA1_BH10CYA1_18230 [soil metagenome]
MINKTETASTESVLSQVNTNLYPSSDHILSTPKSTKTNPQIVALATPKDLNSQLSDQPGNDQKGASQKLFSEWTTTRSGVNFKPTQQSLSDFSPPIYFKSPYSLPAGAETITNQALPAGADMTVSQAPHQPADRVVLSAEVINGAVEAIRAASGVDSFFAWGSVDTKKIEDILQSYSLADRQRIEKAYNVKYEKSVPPDVTDSQVAPRWFSLRDMLIARETWHDSHTHSETAVDVIGLLDKKDGGATFSSQITNALAKLQSSPNDRGAEDELRHALSIMTSEQIQQLTADYKHWQGPKFPNQTNDLQHDLTNNSSISDSTRHSLMIYLKGSDKRTDDDTVSIATRALRNNDAHLFDEALAGSSQTARDQLINSHAEDTIKKAFYWVDQNLALDYLHTGKAGTITEVAANTHWLNKNKKGIEQAIDSASAQERLDFARGDDLVKQGISPSTDADKHAVKFYTDLMAAFHGAAYDWEVDGWVSRMTSGSSNSLIEQISKTHQDGLLGSAIFSSTDTAKLLGVIQNMSEGEWNKLKGIKSGDGTANPQAAAEYQLEIRHAIDDVWMGDKEKQQILTLLQWKIDAPTYDVSNKTPDSQSSSMLSLKNVLDQYQGYGLFNSGRDSTKMLDALVSISPADQQEARQNPEFMKFLHNYVDRLDNGAQKLIGERILDHISKGTSGDSFDATTRFLQAATKDGTALTMINLVEIDKTLQGLVLSDPNYKSLLFDAIDKKLGQPTLLANIALTGIAAVVELGHRVVAQSIVDSLVKTGHVSLDVKLSLTRDDSEKFNAITQMTQADVSNFNSNSAGVLSRFNPAQQELVRNIVASSFSAQTDAATVGASGAVSTAMRVSLADTLRALVLGCVDANSVATALESMELTDADRQQLKADYNSKYHSDLVADVTGKTDGQDRDHLEHLLATVQISAQQDYLKEDHQLNQSWSALDDWMKEGWDGSKEQARARILEYQSSLQELSKNLQQLTPAQQQQFNSKCEEAIQLYRDSKNQLAESAINAAIIGISFVPGLNVIEAGALAVGATVARFAAIGAVGKILGKAAIEGSDYKSDPYSLVKDGITGALAGGFMKAAPGLISKTATKIVGTTGELAESALATTFGRDVSQSASLLAKAPVIQQASNAFTQSASFISNSPIVEKAASVATGYSRAAEAGYTAGFVSGGVNRTLEWNGKQDLVQNANDIWNTALKSGADGMTAAMLFHSGISMLRSGVPIVRSFSSGTGGSDTGRSGETPTINLNGAATVKPGQLHLIENMFADVTDADLVALQKPLADLTTGNWDAWKKTETIMVQVDPRTVSIFVNDNAGGPFVVKGAFEEGKLVFDAGSNQQLTRDIKMGSWMITLEGKLVNNLGAFGKYKPLIELIDRSIASKAIDLTVDSAAGSDKSGMIYKPKPDLFEGSIFRLRNIPNKISDAVGSLIAVDALQNIPRFGSLGQADVYLAQDGTRAVILPKDSRTVIVNTLDPTTGQVQEIRVSNGPQDVQSLTGGSDASASARSGPQPPEPLVLRRKASAVGWNIVTHDSSGAEVSTALTNHYPNEIAMRNAALEYMQEPEPIQNLSNAARAALGSAGDDIRTRIAKTFGRSVYANDPVETVNVDQSRLVVRGRTAPEPSDSVGDGIPIALRSSNGENYTLHLSEGALKTIQSGNLLFSIDSSDGVTVKEGKLGTSRAASAAEIETLRNALDAYRSQSSVINMGDWQNAITYDPLKVAAAEAVPDTTVEDVPDVIPATSVFTLPSAMADGWTMQNSGQGKTVIKDSVNNVSYYFDPANRLNFVGLSDGVEPLDFGLEGGIIEVPSGTDLMPANLDQLNALEKTLNTYSSAYPDSDLSAWYSAIKQIRQASAVP